MRAKHRLNLCRDHRRPWYAAGLDDRAVNRSERSRRSQEFVVGALNSDESPNTVDGRRRVRERCGLSGGPGAAIGAASGGALGAITGAATTPPPPPRY